MLPSGWWPVLCASTGCDVALRVTAAPETSNLLLLSTDVPGRVLELQDALRRCARPAGLELPADPHQFDLWTALPPEAVCLRVQHEGYSRDGQPLGCDYRLYREWVGQDLLAAASYQIVLRRYAPGREEERPVRKQLAWLEIEEPYTPPVRRMQQLLCERLLAPGWFGDESALFAAPAPVRAWQEKIRIHFMETSGRMGFPDPPLAVGNPSDWTAAGCHPQRLCLQTPPLPVQAAQLLADAEVAWLTKQPLQPCPSTPLGEIPSIFVSYASGDFVAADQLVRNLEGQGWRCWMAPRDINLCGLPYTEAISQAIRKVRCILVLLSPLSNLSVHVPREVDLALERRLPVIPVRLADLKPANQLEYLLRTCQWLDLFGREFADASRELAQRLRSLGV
jgi:hypothetical protein